LGIPQFSREKTLLGMAFAGAQVGGGALWFIQFQKRSKWINEEQALEREQLTSAGASSQALAEFDQQSEDYIAGLKQQELIGLATLGLGWGLSVVEALAFSKSSTAKTSPNMDDLQWARASKTKARNKLGISPILNGSQISSAIEFTRIQ
jgi:hypothetical protein